MPSGAGTGCRLLDGRQTAMVGPAQSVDGEKQLAADLRQQTPACLTASVRACRAQRTVLLLHSFARCTVGYSARSVA